MGFIFELDGLTPIFKLLAWLGVLLFIVLLILLIVYAMQRRSLKPLFLFFVLPIVMIGYTGMKSLSFGELKVELSDQLASAGNTEEIKRIVDEIETYDIQDTATLKTIKYARLLISRDSLKDLTVRRPSDSTTARALQQLDADIVRRPSIPPALRTRVFQPRM